jgi:hypothetical protein
LSADLDRCKRLFLSAQSIRASCDLIQKWIDA